MANRDKIPINPTVLKWARQSLGKSLDEIEVQIEDYKSWELGADSPSYSQLEKLAYHIFRRPLAIFFFPEPPEEVDPETEFRILPASEIQNLIPDTRLAIRQAQSYQISLFELSENGNRSRNQIKKSVQLRGAIDIAKTAKLIRDFIGISLPEQKSWRTAENAFKKWRTAFEDVGIYTFKRALKQQDISGFCIDSDEFPVIVINNKNTFTRQVFTLFHELCHLLFDVSGILKLNQSYIDLLEGTDQYIEMTCNKLAGEILVPESDFLQYYQKMPAENYESFISDLAIAYCVSREVIARKLLDQKLINEHDYKELAEKWGAQIRRGQGEGGSYYSTQFSYLGKGFINLAFQAYYVGKIDVSQLAEHLNIKASNVPNFENIYFSRA